MRISDWSSDVCSSDLHAVAVARHVADDLVGADVDDLGTDRDDDGGVLAALAVALLAHAVLAALRAKPLLVQAVDHGAEVPLRLPTHPAACAPIAPLRPSARDHTPAPDTHPTPTD